MAERRERRRWLKLCAAILGPPGIALGLWLQSGSTAAWTVGLPAMGALYLFVVLVVYRRHAAARRHRALLEDLLDPSAGPPAGAPPIELGLAERWAQALTAREWAAARDCLDRHLHVDSSARHYHGRTAYMRATCMAAAAYRERRVQLDEVVAEAGAPEVAWVRFTQAARPRRGPALEATWWERWTVDPARERVLEISFGGVTRLS
jgi:hypothetical protein